MGKKLKEKKGRNGKGKKKERKPWRENRTDVARIDLAQEFNALLVTYCDSRASVLDFYCDSDL